MIGATYIVRMESLELMSGGCVSLFLFEYMLAHGHTGPNK